jgi:ABC-type proline/glycine betaine transport system ATPase subunit
MNDNFAHCTVIFLATRFQIIVQMDKVMVMKHGEIVEFDTPIVLLDNPKSKFSLMLSQTGDVDPANLRQLALKKAAQKEKELIQHQQSIPSLNRTPKSKMPKTLGVLFNDQASSSKNPEGLKAEIISSKSSQTSMGSDVPNESSDDLLRPSIIVVKTPNS